ncbi:MAG: sialidase family protein [Phycisphaerae bacterium]|nr:sialidase family protein [Phycisphaerae bacterium]
MRNYPAGAGTVAIKLVGGLSFILLCLSLLAAPLAGGAAAKGAPRPAASPAGHIEMKLLSVRKIWDNARHNAFTDLIAFDGRVYCVFREGAAHVSPDGKIRVLVSSDFKTWKSAALLAMKGMDLRDAKISRMPDRRLMILGGAAPRKAREAAPTGSFVSFSKDGASWTAPKLVGDPKRWIWRITWHGAKGYAVDYGSGKTTLLATDNGLDYRTILSPMCPKGSPNEATLRFTKDASAYCLQRRRRTALIGRAAPPYKQWTWRDLGRYVGGPNMIRLPSGAWIGAGRFLKPKTHTALFSLDVDAGKIGKVLKLPSGRDTSYPGLLWRDGVLWVSYYSSHESKTSIYLASVKTTSTK